MTISSPPKSADLGGEEIVKNIKEGNTEIEIAIAGRDRMEREIVKTYPDAEYMDTWVWFQSGINTDGAHNPKTNILVFGLWAPSVFIPDWNQTQVSIYSASG